MFDTPVLFLVFNRPDTTLKVFESIRDIKPGKLYLAADAPRAGNLEDEYKCQKVKDIIAQVDWDCEVKRLFRSQNVGCFEAVSGAINWFFENEEMGIILEDDCLPNRDFYFFCEEMLFGFKDNEKIISINGSNLGYRLNNGRSYTFSRFMNMWGWATWRRSSVNIDYDLKLWKMKKYKLLFLYDRLKNSMFDFDINWYKYWAHKFEFVREKKITWDWQWNFHQFENKQLSIVPAVNLVSNIGFNSDATHTHRTDNPAANITTVNLNFPLHHPIRIKPDLKYEEKFVKWVWCYHQRLSKLFYLKQFISKLLKLNKGV